MTPSFGYQGVFRARAGGEEEPVSRLLQATELMEDVEGCLMYVVCRKPEDPAAVQVFEVWSGRESQDASLSLPAVAR